MGFGIILSSDDHALADQIRDDPQAAVADLLAALGHSSYPGTQVAESVHGAWTRHASLHSSAAVALHATETGVEVLPANAALPADTARWAAVGSFDPWPGAGRRPGWPSAMTPPAAPAPTGRSVWWAYADALARLDPAATPAAAAVAQALASPFPDPVPLGIHANALNRAGSVHGPGSVVLWWAGNRLTTAAGLLPDERSRLLGSLR